MFSLHELLSSIQKDITFSVTLFNVNGFCVCRKADLYSAVNDEELDRIISEVHRRHSNTVYKLMHGHLNAGGVCDPSEYHMGIISIYF